MNSLRLLLCLTVLALALVLGCSPDRTATKPDNIPPPPQKDSVKGTGAGKKGGAVAPSLPPPPDGWKDKK